VNEIICSLSCLFTRGGGVKEGAGIFVEEEKPKPKTHKTQKFALVARNCLSF
jgi:hypothetical protein